MQSYPYEAETFLPLVDPLADILLFRTRYQPYIETFAQCGSSTFIKSGNGHAALQPNKDILEITVKSSDYATFRGLQTLLQIGLGFSPDGARIVLKWSPINEERSLLTHPVKRGEG